MLVSRVPGGAPEEAPPPSVSPCVILRTRVSRCCHRPQLLPKRWPTGALRMPGPSSKNQMLRLVLLLEAKLTPAPPPVAHPEQSQQRPRTRDIYKPPPPRARDRARAQHTVAVTTATTALKITPTSRLSLEFRDESGHPRMRRNTTPSSTFLFRAVTPRSLGQTQRNRRRGDDARRSIRPRCVREISGMCELYNLRVRVMLDVHHNNHLPIYKSVIAQWLR